MSGGIIFLYGEGIEFISDELSVRLYVSRLAQTAVASGPPGYPSGPSLAPTQKWPSLGAGPTDLEPAKPLLVQVAVDPETTSEFRFHEPEFIHQPPPNHVSPLTSSLLKVIPLSHWYAHMDEKLGEVAETSKAGRHPENPEVL